MEEQPRLNFRLLSALLKPRFSFSVIFTIIPGLLLGRSLPDAGLVFWTMFGTMLTAMAAFCYNQIVEARTDALMERTKDRALPLGAISVPFAAALGSGLLTAGCLFLYAMVNIVAAGIALFSFVVYVFIYTMWLKPRSVHNTVIGGFSGSIGPLIGEAAVRGTITIEGFAMFMLLFLWQPPHFWALSIRLKDDYAAAGLAMMPVVKGIPYTINQMLFYQVLLIASIVLVTFPLQLGGLIYLIPSLGLGLLVLYMMIRLRSNPSPEQARKIFGFTILHNTVWHLALSIDLYLNRTYLPGI